MFLDIIKEYFLKRFIKNSLTNTKGDSFSNKINSIGLVIDESDFPEKEALIQELISIGFLEQNICVIVHSDKIKKNQVYPYPTFGAKHLNWKAEINQAQLIDFMDQKFDLLINYYALEKAILLQITNISKAYFKVGFSSVDKRLNHLMINTDTKNYQIFVSELLRYLKILNKI